MSVPIADDRWCNKSAPSSVIDRVCACECSGDCSCDRLITTSVRREVRSALCSLGKYLLRDPKAVDCRRKAAVTGCVEQYFLQLFLRPSVVEQAIDVDGQLVAAARREQHAHSYQAATLQVEARAAPDGSPGEGPSLLPAAA